MKRYIVRTILCAGALTSMVFAQEFSQTPKRETLAEAIRFEKYKVAAGEAQARKDAAEAAQSKRASVRKARKEGQADAPKR